MTGPAVAPVFQIHRMYLKDCSVEQPNSPAILFEQSQIQPQVDIALKLDTAEAADGMYDVTITGTVTAKVQTRTLFLVEVEQAGLFEIRNLPAEQIDAILHVNCAAMVYPYLRATVSDLCTRAGFPPVLLGEVDFNGMYQQKQAGAPLN